MSWWISSNLTRGTLRDHASGLQITQWQNECKLFLSNTSKAAAKAKKKCQAKITDGIILLHDSACPHVAHTLNIHPKATKWEVLKHGAYRDSLIAMQFSCLGPLKKPWRMYLHIRWVSKRLCGSVQGILYRLHMPTCAPMGLMSKCLWWFLSTIK